MADQIDCLLMAAGLSSRMGRWKQMLPFLGRPLIDHAVNNALSFCDRVVLVTGFRGEELKAYFEDDERVVCVSNEEYSLGMFSSIQTGVRLIESDFFFVTHGDLPLLPRRVFAELWEARGVDACFPVWQGRRGHPVLLSSRLIESIIQSSGGGAMRHVLSDRKVLDLDLGCAEVCFDIDTPQAYQALLGRS